MCKANFTKRLAVLLSSRKLIQDRLQSETDTAVRAGLNQIAIGWMTRSSRWNGLS